MEAKLFSCLFLIVLSALICEVASQRWQRRNRTERRNHFLQQQLNSSQFAQFEHVRQGLATFRNRRRSKNDTVPQEVQRAADEREQLKQLYDKNTNDSMEISLGSLNDGLEDFLYEGDVMLTTSQVDQITMNSTRAKRQAATFGKWDKTRTINYRFDGITDAKTMSAMRLGAKFWTDNTCLNLVESSATPNIRVFRGDGCYSYVGRVASMTSQDLSLGSGCEYFGVTSHEIGHALGFWHEQSRFDRDSYITIVPSNMDTFTTQNFDKESSSSNNNYGQPYDWGSGMHYAGSRRGGAIYAMAKDKIYQSTMGSYTGPSFKDVYVMNLHYGCMCTSGTTCQNGGFPHPRNCNTCICPSGWGGANCNQRQGAENGATDVGAVLTATTTKQTLSAKTGDPSRILERARAVHWHIQAPAGKKIEITVQSVQGQCQPGCPWGSLDLKVKNFNLVGARYCCASDVAANPVLTTVDNFAIISVYSQAYEHSFTLQYRYIDNGAPSNPTATTTTTTRAPTANCNDVATNCAVNAYLCNDATYRDLMTQKCAKTCNRCTAPPPTNNCSDKTDCSGFRGLCNDPTYFNLMTQQCPRTCGRC